MTDRRGTVKLFTFSFEIDAPNIISCAPKNLHLVAQVLPNSNLNFEPWALISFGFLISWYVTARKYFKYSLVGSPGTY